MTQNEAFEKNQVRSSDATHLVGKLFLSFPAGTAPLPELTITPSLMGARAAAFAAVFSRYRIKFLRFKYLSNGASALGVYDEGGSTEGSPPVNLSDILELRASGSVMIGQTIPTVFEWRPVDTKLWYYTQPGATGSDIRLVNSGVIYAGATTASTGFSLEVDYSITFKGAVDVGSS